MSPDQAVKRFRIPTKVILVIIFIVGFLYSAVSSGDYFHRVLYQPDKQIDDTRGVIVSLIRSTNRSVLQAINMIHSIAHFHSIAPNTSYPLLIFHDQNFTATMRQQILNCTAIHHKIINVSFAFINFTTSVQPDPNSRLEKSMSYRLMCRFWTYDVFYHPAVLNGHYDYLMRMDDDSYFSDTTKYDLFVYMKTKRLDYAFRSHYSEPYTPMQYIVGSFFGNVKDVGACIYNNFFIIRLGWYHESERVQSFVWELLRDDLMLRQYVGDGCAHAVMVKLEREAKVKQLTDFSYGHNYHLMLAREKYLRFKAVRSFDSEVEKSCHQLTIIDGTRRQLQVIELLK
jgi:hypothetical protein